MVELIVRTNGLPTEQAKEYVKSALLHEKTCTEIEFEIPEFRFEVQELMRLKMGGNMKIPSKIRIGGVDYRIEQITGLAGENEVSLNGEVSHTESRILLESQMEHQHKCVVLWHEMLHAIAYQADEELTERQIRVLANGIYQVLQDNGKELFDIHD